MEYFDQSGDNLAIKLTEKDVGRLRDMSDSAIATDLYEIARAAAEKQVKPEHFADAAFV